MQNHNHDLIHHLSETLDSIWRFESYLKASSDCPSCSALWGKLKTDYEGFETLLVEEIKKHIAEGRFD